MSNLKITLILCALAVPAVGRAKPLKLVASVETRACERDPICVATSFADLVSSRREARELRLDGAVVFEPASARVYSAARERLMQVAASWRKHREWQVITVEGYADPFSGSDGLELGQRRADKTRNYLVRYGVDPQFVIAVGRATRVPKGRVDVSIRLHADEQPAVK